MPAGFLDQDAKQAFGDVIRAVEEGSAAEAMVAVRVQSSRWLHAHLIVGCGAAVAALAFMLFASYPFSTTSIFFDPIISGILVGAASTLVRPVKRWLTPRRARRAAVRTAALATFHEKGVRLTRSRTGILVYISIVEQMAEVVADAGVLDAVKTREKEWHAAVAAIDAAVQRGGVATARAAAGLAPLLGGCLPRQLDDLNELPDEVCA
jgi:putative membrane protein